MRDLEVGIPTTSAEGVEQAVVTYCVDVSRLVLIDDQTGEPVEREGISDLAETVTFAKGKDGKWRVALVRNEPASC